MGEVFAVIEPILADGGDLTIAEITAELERRLGEAVSRSTIKNCLADKARGHGAPLERVSRGRYHLRDART